MEYVYLWEINKRVKLGFSDNPSAELHALETDTGVRASRVFVIPVTKGIKRAALLLTKKKCYGTYIQYTFERAKEILIGSAAEVAYN